jgi:drug/metabolite transporter (DMT)-like permease
MMSALWFGVSSLLTFVLASAISAYAAAGTSGSFQALFIISAIAAVLLLVGFGLGGAISRKFPTVKWAAILGVACACATMAMLWVASAAQANPEKSWPMILALPLIGGLASFIQGKLRG